MTYDSYEQSVALGAPIELYDFVNDETGDHFRYNTTSDVVTYGSYDYASGILDRKVIERSGEFVTDGLEVTLERANLLAAMYVASTPEGQVSLTVYRGHSTFFITIWTGIIETVSFDEKGAPTMKCLPRTSGNSGVGKRRRCQRLCDHNLYEYGCNVNQEAFRVNGTIATISGRTIVSSAFSAYSDGWFSGGKIIIGNETRFICDHTTNTIIIHRTCVHAEITDSFRAYPGCDKLAATCNTKFSNKLNFGGAEFLTPKNPFKNSINDLSTAT